MQIPQFLQCIPGPWSGVEMADRVAIMKYCGHPVRFALRDDLLDKGTVRVTAKTCHARQRNAPSARRRCPDSGLHPV